MNGEVTLSASKVKTRKKIVKISKIALLILVLLLLLSYFIFGVIYNNGTFSITLDKNLFMDRGIIIYDDPDYKVFRSELYAEAVEEFDNISYKWLPNDLNNSQGGSHNGDNYVAYTFFVENQGTETADYWSQILIDDVVKRVDEAVRIRVFKNGEEITYAKVSKNGKPEKDTVAFISDEEVSLDHVQNFKPGDIHKYTIVIWLEGNDPECTDNILGGEIKIHMEFNSENIENWGRERYLCQKKEKELVGRSKDSL